MDKKQFLIEILVFSVIFFVICDGLKAPKIGVFGVLFFGSVFYISNWRQEHKDQKAIIKREEEAKQRLAITEMKKQRLQEKVIAALLEVKDQKSTTEKLDEFFSSFLFFKNTVRYLQKIGQITEVATDEELEVMFKEAKAKKLTDTGKEAL